MIICHVYVSKTLKVYVVLFFFIIGGIQYFLMHLPVLSILVMVGGDTSMLHTVGMLIC